MINQYQIKIALVFLFAVAALVNFLTAQSLDRSRGEGKIPVFVSIPPQAYLVKRIGGGHVEVQTLLSQGSSPHFFEPTPRQIAQLNQARLFFKINMPFENQLLKKISAKRLQIVDSTKGIQHRVMEHHHHHHHHHKKCGEGEADPHIWLGIPQIKIMAANIADALAQADPKNATDYKTNMENLKKDLDSTNKKTSQTLLPYRGAKVFVFHPAFGYFTDAYGLEQVSLEIEGKKPSPQQLANLIHKAKKANARVIFAQPQFDPQSAQVIAKAIGGKVVSLDPLAEDILKNLEHIASEIEKALRK